MYRSICRFFSNFDNDRDHSPGSNPGDIYDISIKNVMFQAEVSVCKFIAQYWQYIFVPSRQSSEKEKGVNKG